MTTPATEVYQPRALTNHGSWGIGSLKFKIYGLLAKGKTLTDDMETNARRFIDTDVLPQVTSMGDSNGMGFVIIHPGDLGITVSAHWWAQGSVLCQRIHRKLYDASFPIDTATRPVVACVWELALINTEQEFWRATMMQPVPDPAAYLRARPAFDVV